MPTMTPRRLQARAELASAAAQSARNPEDPRARAEVDDRRRNYRFVAAEDYVRDLVDEAPPLTEDQRRRLAAILQGSAA